MKLDRLVVERLFGDGAWLAGSESAVALNRVLDETGFTGTGARNGEKTHRAGPILERDLNMDLLIVCLGLHWESASQKGAH